MTVREIYGILDKKIPAELSCEWDNDGLMCCPDGGRRVRRVLVALDVTEETVERAVMGDFDMIVSHHPMIFKGLKAVEDEAYLGKKVIELVKRGIAVASFHTRLDALCGGVNDALAAALGLTPVSSFAEGDMGRICELGESLGLSEFSAKVKEALGAPAVLCADGGKAVKRVALLGGEGGDFVRDAMAAGADTYVSGRIGYHSMTDAPEMGINLIEAGHFFTEAPVCGVLRDMLLDADGTMEVEVFSSNRIKAV